MKYQSTYGQYCPLAMSADFLCQRWTMLILREFLEGSSTFNDIGRGVPRMSRTLLSRRLKELIDVGLIQKKSNKNGHQSEYVFTEAGKALGPVVMAMANWGQEWINIEPSINNIDVDLLMWDIRRHTRPLSVLPDPFIVHIFLSDVEDKYANHWLIYEEDNVDLCYIDKEFNVDVYIETTAAKLTKVWMGWENFEQAVKARELIIEGDEKYTSIAKEWLGQSSVSKIKKVKKKLRVV